VLEKGNTLIPLDVHLTGGRAKLALGVCRGKKQYDQREDMAKKDADLDMRREMKRRNRSDD